MLTLMALAVVIMIVGTEHSLLIAITAILIYLYPLKAILFLTFLGLLKWQGMVIKQKLNNYWKKRKPK